VEQLRGKSFRPPHDSGARASHHQHTAIAGMSTGSAAWQHVFDAVHRTAADNELLRSQLCNAQAQIAALSAARAGQVVQDVKSKRDAVRHQTRTAAGASQAVPAIAATAVAVVGNYMQWGVSQLLPALTHALYTAPSFKHAVLFSLMFSYLFTFSGGLTMYGQIHDGEHPRLALLLMHCPRARWSPPSLCLVVLTLLRLGSSQV
jgi:hypothetical protein